MLLSNQKASGLPGGVSSIRNLVEASVESNGGGLFNHGLSDSLKTIRAAKSRFHLLTARGSTQAVLSSQIELCDIMLREIRSISCSFEKRMSSGDVMNRVSGASERSRSGRYPTATQRDRPNRSKRRNSAPRLREHKSEVARLNKEDVT